MATMAEEKLIVSNKASNNKTWAQKASSQQHQQLHDSNNNVSAAVPPQQQQHHHQQKKVVTTTSVAVTAVPGRSPMASPKVRHELVSAENIAAVNGSSAAPKAEPVVVQKANAILQTDAVPQKKLETNTVSVTATPAAINGGVEKPQPAAAAPAPSAPSSWASLFASSQKPSVPDSSNGPVVGPKKPVAKVLPFEGTQVQQQTSTGKNAGNMSYSAASTMGLNAVASGATGGAQPHSGRQQVKEKEEEDNSNTSQAERRGLKLGGEWGEKEEEREKEI